MRIVAVRRAAMLTMEIWIGSISFSAILVLLFSATASGYYNKFIQALHTWTISHHKNNFFIWLLLSQTHNSSNANERRNIHIPISTTITNEKWNRKWNGNARCMCVRVCVCISFDFYQIHLPKAGPSNDSTDTCASIIETVCVNIKFMLWKKQSIQFHHWISRLCDYLRAKTPRTWWGLLLSVSPFFWIHIVPWIAFGNMIFFSVSDAKKIFKKMDWDSRGTKCSL